MWRIKLNINRFLSGLLIAMGIVLTFFGCEGIEEDVLFTGDEYQNILQYIEKNKETYSSFLEIVEVGKMMDVLSSYNSNLDGDAYTLFLPDNDAVESLISSMPQYGSLDEMLLDTVFTKALVRYHVVNSEINSADFPNGSLPKKTLSNDFLTVRFIDQGDEVLYSINGESVVVQRNIQMSNGIIHRIDKMLLPVVYTAYEWLQVNKKNGFQIFSELLEITGLEDTLNHYELDELNFKVYKDYTLFAESDELYEQYGIYSIENLIDTIGPDNTDYTHKDNLLNKFTRYHILNGGVFIDDFKTSLYNTYGDYPISVDFDQDLKFNMGSDVYETVIVGEDTTQIYYLTIDLERSNKLTKTGPIHQLDYILHPFLPGRKTETFQFFDEVEINKLRRDDGTTPIRKEDLNNIELFGVDKITYTKGTKGPNNTDYIKISGNFEFTYTTPQILAGAYEVTLRAHRNDIKNASLLVYLDGEKLGTLVDLTSGSLASNDFNPVFEMGTIDFAEYQQHEIRLISLVPGILMLDYIRFTPIGN
ncbi:MAG: fasciclin domain-containing protein [Bacteroidales bacterium]|nr:fasciclin domain-containing protein [Bacteroidales bacterium]